VRFTDGDERSTGAFVDFSTLVRFTDGDERSTGTIVEPSTLVLASGAEEKGQCEHSIRTWNKVVTLTGGGSFLVRSLSRSMFIDAGFT
jgi:hypothetical protein